MTWFTPTSQVQRPAQTAAAAAATAATATAGAPSWAGGAPFPRASEDSRRSRSPERAPEGPFLGAPSLRRGSICSLASLTAPSVVAAGGPPSGGPFLQGAPPLFRVYIHSITDLDPRTIGASPLHIRICPVQQQQQKQQQQQQQEEEDDEEVTAAKRLLLDADCSSSSATHAVVSGGLCFIPFYQMVSCYLPSPSVRD